MKTVFFSKQILKCLLVSGVVIIGAGSPYLFPALMRDIGRMKKTHKRKYGDAFYYLKKKGMIELHREGHDVRIALTAEGKKRAGKYQIDDLAVKRPKRWDGKWRVIIFDIPTTSNVIRDVFRRKLKELGFYSLQKSIWVYPFPCKKEIILLRSFLGTTTYQIRFMEVNSIENDSFLRKRFKI